MTLLVARMNVGDSGGGATIVGLAYAPVVRDCGGGTVTGGATAVSSSGSMCGAGNPACVCVRLLRWTTCIGGGAGVSSVSGAVSIWVAGIPYAGLNRYGGIDAGFGGVCTMGAFCNKGGRELGMRASCPASRWTSASSRRSSGAP